MLKILSPFQKEACIYGSANNQSDSDLQDSKVYGQISVQKKTKKNNNDPPDMIKFQIR